MQEGEVAGSAKLRWIDFAVWRHGRCDVDGEIVAPAAPTVERLTSDLAFQPKLASQNTPVDAVPSTKPSGQFEARHSFSMRSTIVISVSSFADG